jgi:hypothetical protein
VPQARYLATTTGGATGAAWQLPIAARNDVLKVWDLTGFDPDDPAAVAAITGCAPSWPQWGPREIHISWPMGEHGWAVDGVAPDAAGSIEAPQKHR